MELTREELVLITDENGYDKFHETLAKQLLAEMNKPKIWDSVHTTVDKARIVYYAGDKCLYDKEHTRTLPKSRIDEIAEEARIAYHKADGSECLDFFIKSAILKDREERGEK